MLYTIVNDQPFQVLSDSFTISPSESGYELYLSADGVNYSQFITVPSGVTKQMVDMNNGNFYRLMGNTSIVTVNWSRDCCGGQGGGGGVAGVSSLNGRTGALTTKTINGNDILGTGDITIEGGGAQYDLDAMTQAERAEFVAMCENLTDEERRLLFVYRDGVICTFDHTEGSGNSFKIGFFDTRNDGWSYTTTKYRHFFAKADGSYEESGYAAFPEIITYDTNYSDTTHALSSSDNFSPLNAISNLNAGQDGKVALNLRLIIQSSPAKIVLSSKAWSERISNLEGKIGAEWHYNGNVITAVWNVVENNATIDSWTEVPEGESGAKTYVLNLMTNDERIALLNEISSTYPSGSYDTVSSGFPVSDYQFYYYIEGYGDDGNGFIPLRITTVSPQIVVRFEGILNGYAARTFKELTLECLFDGNITVRKNAVYNLPTASSSTLGGIKIGNGLSIDADGVLSAKVVSLSQSDYDALVQAGTVDANTLYVII